ncbi:MAG: Gfo/Idh/MocA family protein [Thermoguttaceae bacterium]
MQTNRRNFLKVTAAAPLVVPASALGYSRSVAPSNRINVGFCGVGCMNRGHLAGTLPHADVQVVAVSDPDQWRRENGQKMVEDAYSARKANGEYKGCDVYNSFHEMLPRDDIDALVMALGEQWHGPAVIMAAKAGKDIYVEKPCAYTIDEARGEIEAVRRFGCVAQVGFQQRSHANFQHACKLVQDGAIGKVRRVYMLADGASVEIDLPFEPTPPTLNWDVWLGPAPYRPFSSRLHYLGMPLNVVPWHFCRDLGLGGLGSGGTHAFDVVHWALGLDTGGPVEITPRPIAPYITYKYDGGVELQVIHGRLDPNVHEIPKGFDPNTVIQVFGALFVGDDGWIHVGRQGYLTSYPTSIAKDRPSRYEGHFSHVRNWLDCIKTRKRPNCDIATGTHSTMDAILGNIAYWLERPLKWDPVKYEFIGDDEANRLRSRALREPWTI